MDPSLVYWEQQSAALCGRHALNNLLQGAFYSEVELAELARQLDDSERQVLLAGGASADDVAAMFADGSPNVDDAGNFSISVLREALQRVNGLQLEQTPALVARALQTPDAFDGFFLNRDDHWYAVRRLPTASGPQYFNLNSLLSAPEIISTFYLSAYLTQLKADGFSVFVVTPPGALPPAVTPATAHRVPAGTLHTVGGIMAARGSGEALRRSAAKRARDDATGDPQLVAALAASLAGGGGGGGGGGGARSSGGAGGGGLGGGSASEGAFEAQMRAAMAASMVDASSSSSSSGGGGGGVRRGAAPAASVAPAAFGGAGNRLGGNPPADALTLDDSDDESAAMAMSLRAPAPAAPPARAAASSGGGGGPGGGGAGGAAAVAALIARLTGALPPEPLSPVAGAAAAGASAAAPAGAVARVQLRLPLASHPLGGGAAGAPLSPAAATRQRRFAVDDALDAVLDWAQLCWLQAYCGPASAGAGGAAPGAAASALVPFELVLPASAGGGSARVMRSSSGGPADRGGGATVGGAGLAPSASLTLRLAAA